ncbi:hypothetical protein N7465_004925 [Penicillium sp. CMV-2018d]|nr:hypothetical protein N7465_004925 [Penicillium sp. CMV-2018d]
MIGGHETRPELNEILCLLSQLARHFEANETKFTSRDCKSLLGCLPEIERTSLQRLTVLLCLNRCTGPGVVPVAWSVISQDKCCLSSTVYPNSEAAAVSVSIDIFTPDSTDDRERDLLNETSHNSPNIAFVDTATLSEENTAHSHTREQSLNNEASASVTASREAVNPTEPDPHQVKSIPAKPSCRELSLEVTGSSPGKSTWEAPLEISSLSVRCSNNRESSPSTVYETTEGLSSGAFLEPSLLDERYGSLIDATSQDSHLTPPSVAEQSTPTSPEEVISSPAADVSQEPPSHRAANFIQSSRATIDSYGEVQTDHDDKAGDDEPEEDETVEDEPEEDEPEEDEPEEDEPEEDEPEEDEAEEGEPEDDEPGDDESHHTVSEVLRGTNFETCSVALPQQLRRILKECSADYSHFLRNVDESCLPSGGSFSGAFYKIHKREKKTDLYNIYQRFECLNLYRLAVSLGYHTGTKWAWSAVDDLAKEIQTQYPLESFGRLKTRLRNIVYMGRRYNIWAKHLGNFGYLIALPLRITPTE